MKLQSKPSFFIKLFYRLGKRQRFIIASFLSTFFILASSFFSLDQAEYFTVLLLVIVYILTFFSVLEDINGVEWLMLFLLPVYFTLSFYLFYFLLPVRWLTRLPYISIYAISIYAILLSANIFNIGVTKNLHLFRAAFSVNYLYLTVTSFITFNLILSFRQIFYVNFILIFLASYPLALHFLWTINPKTHFLPNIRSYAFVVAMLLGEAALIFSFTPIKSTIFALSLTALFYSLCGLLQAHSENMLFRKRVREYIFVLVFVLLIVLLSTQWV